MAKIRVHELAAEVGVSNKEVIDYLSGKGYDIKTAVSLVPDKEADNFRGRYGLKKQAEAQEDRRDVVSPASDKEAKAKKKGGIIRVFRSQNATGELQRRPKKAEPPKEEPVKKVEPKAETGKETVVETSAPMREGKAADTMKAQEVKKNTEVKNKETLKKDTDRTQMKNGQAASSGDDVSRRKDSQKRDARPGDRKNENAPRDNGGRRDGRTGRPDSVRHEGSRDAGRRPQGSGNGDRGRYQGSSQGTGRGERSDRPYGGQGRFGSSFAGGRNGERSGDRTGARGGSYQGTRNDRGSRSGGYQGAGQGSGRGERSDRPMGGGQNRQGGSYGNGRSGDRTQGGTRTFNRPGNGGSSFASHGRPSQGGRPQESDGALAHKTSRDFHKDSKEKDRTREERRENGKRSGNNNLRPNQQKKQFNHVPKALQKKPQHHEEKKVEEKVTEIRVPDKITIRDLAERMKIDASQIVKELFMKGEMLTVNHEIPYEKAEEIALDHDILCEKEEKEDVIGELLAEEEEDEKDLVSRPPVVCVMGHVDHGKTSLLDAIRHTHVTEREAGGITQAIGAYMVSIKGQKITFLDTPGHEAFTAMRMRGANATDIAVLVVAADDGVMPQTIEAIHHAQAANTDIIVAVNKIDKPGANIDRVKQELSEYGLVAEDWGGDTIFCPVSAKTHEGIDNLLEMILLAAEVKELKANPNRLARGIVLEAKLDKGRGPVASILVQKGTLHQGDFVACGSAHGKVRAMNDENGKRLHKATPSMPVEITGLSDVPEAGEVLMSFESDKDAKDFASVFVTEEKKNLLEGTRTQMSLDDLFEQIQEGSLKELPIVVKADVQGSVEAVSQSLGKLTNDEVVVKIIHGGVGAITESDVSLAAASNAIIIGFNVRPDATAKSMAETQKVDIHLYNVIYEAIEDVERAINGMKAAVYEEQVQGHLEIRQMFKASGVGNIAGSYVKDGIIQRSSKVRVFRGEEKIFEGELASLKRFKDDVKEVKEGFECGLVFDGWGDFEIEDTVEAYTMVEVDPNEKKQSKKSEN
ncbi:MAG: translation initiation factor IF-2 [Lachnospiraceae bacterium]|nr:translation initiation factor IF-2 [Lachnospiraceae bacterium]